MLTPRGRLIAAVTGTIAVGVCCFTPILVIFAAVVRDELALVERLRREKYEKVLKGLDHVTLSMERRISQHRARSTSTEKELPLRRS